MARSGASGIPTLGFCHVSRLQVINAARFDQNRPSRTGKGGTGPKSKHLRNVLGNISEGFRSGVGVGVGKTNAHLKNNAHVNQLASTHEPPFGTDLDPLPEQAFSPETENEKHHDAGARNGTSRAPELVAQQEVWFKTWWEGYWHKRAKKQARDAFRKHVKTEERFQVVMAAMRAQRPEMFEREPFRRPYASTWLNGERWEDELQPVTVGHSESSVQYLTEEVIEERRRKKFEGEADGR